MSRMDQAAKRREERRLKAETETTDDFGVGRVAGKKRMQDRANGTTTGGSTTTPATTTTNYNVGVSKGGVPFAESFKYHKDKGQKTFTWNGKRYTTDLKDEVKPGAGNTGTGTTGTGKADDKKKKKRRGFLSGFFKKSTDGKTAGERFRDKKAGGGMMKKKGFSQGGLSEKSDGKRLTRRGYRKPLPGSKTTNYNVGVSRGGVPFAESFKYHKDKGQKTFTWNGKKYTTDVKAEGKTSTQEASASKKPDSRNRSRKRMMRKAGGGMMAKKGYSKGGPVRGKPRGVGAAVRGYGKALK